MIWCCQVFWLTVGLFAIVVVRERVISPGPLVRRSSTGLINEELILMVRGFPLRERVLSSHSLSDVVSSTAGEVVERRRS